MTTTRRIFLLTAAAGATTLSLGTRAQTSMLSDQDPLAKALGYVADASRADSKKFPKFAAGQHCTNCALYQGKATDAGGSCPLFASKQVAGKGWCSAWAPKG